MDPGRVLDTKTYWLTDRQSQYDLDLVLEYGRALRRQKVEASCEMAVRLRGREPVSRGTSTVGRRYQTTKWRPRLKTLVFVW
jgi:hypothetical protein